MKQDAIIAGVGVTRFGKHTDKKLSDIAHDAILQALNDAGIAPHQIQAAWAGNAAAPVITGQVCIAGQAMLRGLGIGRIPVINVENACATSSTAFQQAASMVTMGAYDIVLAFGFEKLYHPDKSRVFSVFDGCADIENPDSLNSFIINENNDTNGAGKSRSVFMDVYARMARDYMSATGAQAKDFAAVTEKNSLHGSLNPCAQYQNTVTAEEILNSKSIISPLTLLMCSPIADGASAAVIMSPKAARKLGVAKPVRILSSVLASGYDYTHDTEEKLTAWTARQAYELSGVDPQDISCVELHDASSPAELIYYESLGLCAPGDSLRLLHDGETKIGGKIPVNTSGGLVRKGHPIGATGIAQLHELTLQLRGTAGKRQVDGAKLALAENGGGSLGADSAAIVITVLSNT